MPEEQELTEHQTKKKFPTGVAIGLAATFVVASCTGLRTYKIIPPRNTGLEVKAGAVQPELLKPGFHAKAPLYDKIYYFQDNTVILEETVGDGNNTQDQNAFSAAMRVHYTINRNDPDLSYHISDYDKDNGQKIVTEQMNKAMNAVTGQFSTPQILIASPEILDAFYKQLDWRLKQNKITVTIDTVEYLTAFVGYGTSSSSPTSNYGLRLPVQLLKTGNNPVASMSDANKAVPHYQIVMVNPANTDTPKAAAAPSTAPAIPTP